MKEMSLGAELAYCRHRKRLLSWMIWLTIIPWTVYWIIQGMYTFIVIGWIITIGQEIISYRIRHSKRKLNVKV